MSTTSAYWPITNSASDAFVASDYNNLSTAPVCRIRVEPQLPPEPVNAARGPQEATKVIVDPRGVQNIVHGVTVTDDLPNLTAYQQSRLTNIPHYRDAECRTRYIPNPMNQPL